MRLIKAHDITLKRKSTQILKGISLDLHAGELLGLLGPSGCGKSTLVRVLLGLLTPSSGRIERNPRIFGKDGAHTQQATGYVPQDDIVHGALTVTQALTYALRLRQDPEASKVDLAASAVTKRVDECLKRLDLGHRAHTRIKHLSGGERKRVNLGTELLTEPPLLFLDEPTAGLDPHLEREMMKLFRRLVTPERSVLVTTHRLANISLFDTILLIVDGTLVFGGSPTAALDFFQVDDHERIYSKLRLLPAPSIAAKFRQSPHYEPFLKRKPQGTAAPAAAQPLPKSPPTKTPEKESASAPTTAPAALDAIDPIEAQLQALKARQGKGTTQQKEQG